MAAPPPSPLDGNQVLQHSFCDATGELRVKGTFSAPPGGIEIILDHTEDSVRLGDGTDFFTSTTNGSSVGLDVNLINDEISIAEIGVASPVIVNVPVTIQGQQYTAVVPQAAKRFEIKTRNKSRINLAYISGDTSTNYISIKPGAVLGEDKLELSADLNLYFSAPNKVPDVVEVWYWS